MTGKTHLHSNFSGTRKAKKEVHIYFILFLSDEEGAAQSESEEKLPDLPLLSEQLLLDELWDMLGECLKELEESHDQHAVLGRWNN